MPYRYVPLLRSKAGEATALQNLEPLAKDRIFPIIHLSSAVPATFVAKVGAAWTGRALAVDGLYNFNETASGAALTIAVNGLRAAGVTTLPCIEVNAPAAYAAHAAGLVNNDGLVLKVRLGDIPQLLGWLGHYGWQPAAVDLVVLAGHVADFGAGVLEPVVSHALQNSLPHEPWRSVTLASSAAPKDHGALALGANMVPRLDWELWQNVSLTSPVALDYGDYGVSHPNMTEPPGVAMVRATVSVRYTLDDHWLVLKGRPITGATGRPMATQYRGHARSLVAAAGYGGLLGCWGDARIAQIAASPGPGNAGSRQTWVEIAVNRHLSLVADRLP